jgi:hypothetical protein
MVRVVARCPYCGRVSARLDDAGPDLVMAPERDGGAGCRPMAFLSVGLEAFDPDGVRDDGWTRVWLWVRGKGLRLVPSGKIDYLAEQVDLIAWQIPVEGEDPPRTDYRIGGMAYWEREADRPGTGEFPLRVAGRRLVGVFDGLGLYSTDPDALVKEVHRRVVRPDCGRAAGGRTAGSRC